MFYSWSAKWGGWQGRQGGLLTSSREVSRFHQLLNLWELNFPFLQQALRLELSSLAAFFCGFSLLVGCLLQMMGQGGVAAACLGYLH